jgi:hypothetical protein
MERFRVYFWRQKKELFERVGSKGEGAEGALV